MKKALIDFLLYVYNIKKSYLIRQSIKRLIGKEKIEILFNGFKMYAGVNSAIESNVIFQSYNEIKVLDLITKYSSKGYDFVDVGANIGIHSMTAAKANSSIEIYSFEPEPDNFINFIKNIGLNRFKNIRPFKMGLGNSKSNNFLNINEGWNNGKHSLKVNFQDDNKRISIPVNQLDSFKEYVNKDYLLLKIDVEGFEKEVLEGAEKILKRTANIVVLIELITEINSTDTCNLIVEMLKELQFSQIYKVTSENTLAEVSNYENSGDYVFIKGNEASTIL